MKRWVAILAGGALAGVLGAETDRAPSLVSRGWLPPGNRARGQEAFRARLGAISGYDNGILTAGLDRGEGLFQELAGGVESRRPGRRVNFRMDYQFGLRHYSRLSRLNHSNHSLNLDARIRLSRRFLLEFRDVAASSAFGGSFLTPATDLSSAFFLDGEPAAFHSRSLANTALADLVFSPSVRTSMSAGGDGFIVRRQYHGLADLAGWRARADLAHRYSRHRTITVSYSLTHFDHTRAFGGADYRVYTLGHSWRWGKNSELGLLAGAGRVASAGVRAVELDPQISRLLGTSRGAEIFRVDTWTPHLLAAWSLAGRRWAWRAQLSRLVSDGGGFSGLARQSHASVAVSAPVGRGWRLAGNLQARTFRSLDTRLLDSVSAAAGGSLSRRLGPRLEAVWRYHYSFYDFHRGLLRHFHRHQAAAGVVYHFQDLPVAR